MKIVLCFLIFLGSFAFAQNAGDENAQSRAYLGCKAYPKWHYKACKTDKQHIYQQGACKRFRICYY